MEAGGMGMCRPCQGENQTCSKAGFGQNQPPVRRQGAKSPSVLDGIHLSSLQRHNPTPQEAELSPAFGIANEALTLPP